MDKISIIVPIYNVEKYLHQCVDSLISQTYKNIEIILVDDGSPDNCGQICDEYAKKDKRIKVVHKKNGGLSDARNKGRDIATGSYLTFIDSDDYVNENYCQTLYELITKNNADFSICGYANFYEGEEPIKENKKIKVINFDSHQAMDSLVYSDLSTNIAVAWGKLYKKELFNNLDYPVGKINEDEFVIHHLINNSSVIVYTNEPLYYYLQRKDSIMGKAFNIKRFDYLEALKDRIELLKKLEYTDLYNKSCEFYNHLLRTNYYKITEKLTKKQYREIRNRLLPLSYFKDNPHLNLKARLSYYLFKYFPKIYKKVKV